MCETCRLAENLTFKQAQINHYQLHFIGLEAQNLHLEKKH